MKFHCDTCKRKVNRFLVEGELVHPLMSDMQFNVIKSFDGDPAVIGVRPQDADKFKIFNYGYWINKAKEAILKIEHGICYECRSEVPIWGYKSGSGEKKRRVSKSHGQSDKKDQSNGERSDGSSGKKVRSSDSRTINSGVHS